MSTSTTWPTSSPWPRAHTKARASFSFVKTTGCSSTEGTSNDAVVASGEPKGDLGGDVGLFGDPLENGHRLSSLANVMQASDRGVLACDQHLAGKVLGLECSVSALADVDLDVSAGEVVALVGDNGAGKSTLIKTIAGTLHPDEGRIFIGGREVRIGSPQAASELGIATVYQDLALCENLDVVTNLFLGKELARPPLAGALRLLNEVEMERKAHEVLRSLSINLPSLRRPVSAFSGGQRQAIAVSRALLWGSKLVLLDEPTAALGVEQTAHVLGFVRRLAQQGQAVLLVSHSLPDVFTVAGTDPGDGLPSRAHRHGAEPPASG